MSFSRIVQLTLITLGKCHSLGTSRVQKSIISSTHKSCSSSSDSQQAGKYSWINSWRWYIPLGIGISFLTIYIRRHFQRNPRDKTFAQGLVIECYCHLPLRITSRVWGWIASIELPNSLRPTLYKFYARTFSANLDEIDSELSSFPSLVDFFVRPLKSDARPIANNTNIISPSDGKIMHMGPINNCHVEQVKGVTYDLRHFLGDNIDINSNSPKEKNEYITSLLKNSKNQLYQLSVYLAPGDYHRFHSPADWNIKLRRHFQGKLLSVNPKVSKWVPNLFSLNERAIYVGEWTGGFMAYAVVGATNVGSIRVFRDDNLITNTRKWPRGKLYEEARFDNLKVQKGELFGEFRMGSTIVLLFEAPQDFQFCLRNGERIKVGQGLADCFVSN